MMAKMFYTLDETRAALNKNEEEIKQLTREGKLREFRDGPRLMFKADQVEAIKAEMGGGGLPMDIGVSDTGAPIGLADSRSASATGISLVDSDVRSASGSGMAMKDDTALAADLGLSGSMGGVPSPGRPGSGTGLSGTAAGRSGVTVFNPDEVEHADPSAQTNISSSVGDQVNLEGVGSGSGLLDLTRESDDTSLGAELLDEITPGGSGSRRGDSALAGTKGGSAAGGTAAGGSGIARATGRGGISAPVYVEAPDGMAPALGGAALGAALFVLFGGIVLFSAVMHSSNPVTEMVKDMKAVVLAGIGAGVCLVFAVVGAVIGKVAR